MVCSELLDDIVDVVKKRVDVPFASEKTGNATNADVPASVSNRLDNLVRLASNVRKDTATRRMAGDHRLCRSLSRFQTGLPSAVSTVSNHPNAIHFRYHCSTKVAQAAIRLLRTAVADHVSTVVGKVHHPNAKFKEDSQVPQFALDRLPLLSERHSVSGQIKAVPPRLFGGDNVFRSCSFRTQLLHHVRHVGKPRKAFEQHHHALPFLAGILKNTRHP